MRKTFIPLMVALIVAVSSCTLGVGSTATFDTSDLSEFQGKYMTTFDIRTKEVVLPCGAHSCFQG
jgi:hypothetical protein